MLNKARKFKNNYLQYQFLIKAGENSTDKRMLIGIYLISHISIHTNSFIFSRKQLSRKFNCDIQTVNRAIKLLQSIPDYTVDNDQIRYTHDFRKDNNNEEI